MPARIIPMQLRAVCCLQEPGWEQCLYRARFGSRPGVNGGKSVTLTAGQTFYEGPNDIHTVGHNASKTEPAKFVVSCSKTKTHPF
jgi:hypothetical protein